MIKNDFKKLYLKYKTKYLNLKGGSNLKTCPDLDNLEDLDIFSSLNDIIFEELKEEDIDEFILCCFSSNESCYFLFLQTTILISNELFSIYFSLIFEIFKYNYLNIDASKLKSELKGELDRVPDLNRYSKNKSVIEIMEELDMLMNQVFTNAKIMITQIVKKPNDESKLNFIRIVKLDGYIIGYYKYDISYNYFINDLIEDSNNISTKNFFINLKNKLILNNQPILGSSESEINSINFNVLYLSQICSFSKVKNLYPRKGGPYVSLFDLFNKFKSNTNSYSIGSLLWNNIKNFLSTDDYFNNKATCIILYIDDEKVIPFHTKHGCDMIYNYKDNIRNLEIIQDDMSLHISTTLKVPIDLAIDYKKYITYLIEDNPDFSNQKSDIWVNFIGLKEKEERRNLIEVG